MKLSLIIMAAGMGSRYGGLKQIDSLGPNGEILMEYAVYDAIRAGFSKVIFVIRKDFENEFKDKIGNKFKNSIQVCYAFQALDDIPKAFQVPEGRVKPWGTGQAILSCKDLVNEPFVVQNADDFYGYDAYKTIFSAFNNINNNDGCLVGYPIFKTLSPHGSVTRGLCKSTNGLLQQIDERMKIENKDGKIIYYEDEESFFIDNQSICSMNFWGFPLSYMKTLENEFVNFLTKHGSELKSEWLIPDIVDNSIKNNETDFHVLSCESNWFGVTYPEDKPRVIKLLSDLHEQGEYPSKLW